MRLIITLAKDMARLLKGFPVITNKSELNHNIPQIDYKEFETLTEEDRIISSLVLGNPCNIAVNKLLYTGLTNQGKKAETIYIPLFPETKIQTAVSPDSSIWVNDLSVIIYYELFTTIKNSKMVKANVVTKVPVSLLTILNIKSMILANAKQPSIKPAVKPVKQKISKTKTVKKPNPVIKSAGQPINPIVKKISKTKTIKTDPAKILNTPPADIKEKPVKTRQKKRGKRGKRKATKKVQKKVG
jgi:hypothetical protein